MSMIFPSPGPAPQDREPDRPTAAGRHNSGARRWYWAPRVSMALLPGLLLLSLAFLFSFSESPATRPLHLEPATVFRARICFETPPPEERRELSLKRLLAVTAQAAKITAPEGAWRAKARVHPASGFSPLRAEAPLPPALPREGIIRLSGVRIPPEFTLRAGMKPGPGRVSLDSGRVRILTGREETVVNRLGANSVPPGQDLFHTDMFADGGEALPLLYGEALDREGMPLRWNEAGPERLLALAAAREGEGFGLCEVRHEIWADGVRKFAGASDSGLLAGNALSASRYRKYVEQYAGKYNLTTSLVFAIMHTESNFNPFAVSRNNALGLMQVVAATAGGEVYAFLTGKAGTPSMETLFDPEHNIHYGTAYLHLLARRYFGDVLNTASREMCVIAAYNGGPGAVLRVFDNDMDMAIVKINALSPEDLYATLTEKMPSPESRRYVSTVITRMRNYN